MRMRTMVRAGSVLAAVAAGVAAGVMPAGATTEASWYPVLLQLPDGYPNATGYLTGTDGKGGYAGEFAIGDTSQVVTWTNGRPTVRGVPDGYEFASVADENGSGVVLGNAIDYDTGLSRGFTLDSHGFHLLPPPSGLSGSVDAVSINDRGDVVGAIGDQTNRQTVLWPALGSGPVVIPNKPDVYPRDLDQDGTILFNSDSGPFLWRSGVTTKLAKPGDYTYVSSIRNGSVVGRAGDHGYLWQTPGTPVELPGGSEAHEIGKSGLISGRLPIPNAPYGPLAIWQGTNPLGKLPLPTGFKGGSAYAIGDDDVIAGIVSNGPLDEGGVPVVWQRTP
ncbi:hypothetical protein [Amycolatopsis sp. NPDC059657]|uniref:hypothetical protein n=1 Tax=Amycolatopsis sp. NPDC059657 TaxID=3346899 RepID=UPI003670367A